MLRLPSGWLVALAFIATTVACARADDLELCNISILDTSLFRRSDDHGREVVAARADLTVWDGNRAVRPPRVDTIFVVEREQGERVEIRERSDRRVRGWAAARDLVPVNRAESFFAEAIRADGRTVFPRLMRAVVRYHLQELEPARADLDDALRIDPRCVEALERRSWIETDRQQFDRAQADIDRAIELRPGDPRLLLSRATLRSKLGETKADLAIADLDQAIRVDATDPDLFLMRAVSETVRGKIGASHSDVQRALALDADDPRVLLMSATVMVQDGYYREARKLLAERLEAHPDHDLAYEARIVSAVIDFEKRMFPLGMLELRRAIELDPGKEEAYLLRAAERLELGFPDLLVLRDLDAAIRASPRNPECFTARATFRCDRFEYGPALADMESAIRVAPADADLHGRRARLLATCPDAKIRNGREAVASATRACELSGWTNPDHLTTLAAAGAEAGDFRAAVACQEKAIALLPKHDFRADEYRRTLGRYQSGKPSYRLGLLEEWGIRTANRAAN